MRPSLEARLGLGLLLALQLTTSLAGVGLLGRMAPAVEQILVDNVASTRAVEDMLAALAGGGDAQDFYAALARAEANVTEAEEPPLLRALRDRAGPALAGDDEARADVVLSLRQLSAVNHRSMERADVFATRLGLGGAWAMALLGFVGFLASLGASSRVDSRLLDPLAQIDDVLAAVRAGDERRRLAGVELHTGGRLMTNLNWLLDHKLTPLPCPSSDPTLRAAVVGLLDQLDAPALLLDPQGRVIAASAQALERAGAEPVAELAAREGWPEVALRAGVRLRRRTAAREV